MPCANMASNMATCSIFEEDEVYISSEKGYKCGLILECSEYVSSDEEENSPGDYERVRKGTVRVAWHPEGKEEVVPEKNVKLADRSLMPGDVVRRLIEGQDSQRGYVRNTQVKCHIQILGQNKVIQSVNSTELAPLAFWDTEPGDVTLDSWVGKIERIAEDVTLTFPDGAKIVVSVDDFLCDLSDFCDVNEKRDKDTEFCGSDFYPGQVLHGELGELTSAEWLISSPAHSEKAVKKHAEREIYLTVEKVEPKAIDVHWLCRGYAKIENPLDKMKPPMKCLGKDDIQRLKKLDCFEPCSVQIGDRAFYILRDSDIIHTFPQKSNKNALDCILKGASNPISLPTVLSVGNDSTGNCVEMEKKLMNDNSGESGGIILEATPRSGSKDGPEAGDFSMAVETGCIDLDTPELNEEATNGDKLEDYDAEDDSEYEDIDDGLSDAGSAASANSNASGSDKKRKSFRKGTLATMLVKKKKLKRAKQKFPKKEIIYKPGDVVPVEIIYTKSTIEVMWQDGTVERGIHSTELYPIHHLDELEFFPGDYIIRNTESAASSSEYGVVEKVDHAGRTCFVRWMKPYQPGKSNRPDESIVSEEASVYDIKDHTDYKFRPGHVVVRVGGLEGEEFSEAAGQVYELTTDGRIMIQWADFSKSYCYPQDLYLYGDELSELGSDYESSSDSDVDDSMADSSSQDSEESWETEDEEEVEEVAPDGEEEEKVPKNSDVNSEKEKSEHDLRIKPETKFELDMLLDTARTTLQKLEDTFAQHVDIACYVINCYREILRIHRTCRDLDNMLKSSYFDDQTLVQTVSTIKKELKKEKASKIHRQVLEMFESNCKNASGEPKEINGPLDECCKGRKTDTCKHHTKGKDTSSQPELSRLTDSKLACHAQDEPTEGKMENGHGSPGSTANIADNCAVPDVKVDDENSNKATTNGAEGAVDCVETLEKGDPSSQDSLTGPQSLHNAKSKDLCQSACRLLKEQIVKVHNDLEKQWQKMRKEGLLEELQDEEIEDDGAANSAFVPPGLGGEERLVGVFSPLSGQGTKPVAATPPSSLPLSSNKDEQGNTPSTPGRSSTLGIEPPTPQTQAEIRAKIQYNVDGFTMIESVPESHHFKAREHQPSDGKTFFTAVKKELKLLRTSLPLGIFVKGYEDRMDLFTVMIEGPQRTPYEDGLFFFDVHLPNDYPTAPPNVFFISYSPDRLNPNLYVDGKVCVSLLGTWAGKGTEMWTSKSSLLQVMISIQGLILGNEPYYNEAGYEKQRGTQLGYENSRMYNELAILKMVQSMVKMVTNPPAVFEVEVMEHMKTHAFRMIPRLEDWLRLPAAVTISSSQGTSNAAESTTMAKNSADHVLPPASSTSTESQLSAASAIHVPMCANGSCNITPAKAAGAECLLENTSEPREILSFTDFNQISKPGFPLLPVSKGFVLTLRKQIDQFRLVLKSVGIEDSLVPNV